MEDNLPGEHYQTQIIDDHKSWTSIFEDFPPPTWSDT